MSVCQSATVTDINVYICHTTRTGPAEKGGRGKQILLFFLCLQQIHTCLWHLMQLCIYLLPGPILGLKSYQGQLNLPRTLLPFQLSPLCGGCIRLPKLYLSIQGSEQKSQKAAAPLCVRQN